MSFISRLVNNSVISHTAAILLATGIGAGVVKMLETNPHSTPPFQARTREELKTAVWAAKNHIYAAGLVLSDIDADYINARYKQNHDFKAIVVMVDPLGAGGLNRVICQRQRDEDGDSTDYSNYGRILNKLTEFHSKTGKLLKDTLQIGVIDKYPTMAVLLVDDDLYVYCYPYHSADSSPVIKFENYTHGKDPRADFFVDNYLNKITGYLNQQEVRKTKFLTTEKDWAPYLKPAGDPGCTAK